MKYKTLTITLIAILSVSFMINCIDKNETNSQNESKIYTNTRNMMDTQITVTVVDNDSKHAEKAIENAFQKIKYIDNDMNYFNNSTNLSKLNQNSNLINANRELIYVINKSIYYKDITHGAFDITILPVLELWKSKFSPHGTHQPPTKSELNYKLHLVNASNITLTENNISMEKGMKITLGGIAKGYAVDLAVNSLYLDGIKSGFVDAGGNGRYFGHKPDNSSWKVGLKNPNTTDQFITIIILKNESVATSGNYERYFNDSAKVSHISDPRTGYPAENLISATVITSNGIDSDALSTSLFVLGERDGLALAEKLDDVECLLITKDKRIVKSSGFNKYENLT